MYSYGYIYIPRDWARRQLNLWPMWPGGVNWAADRCTQAQLSSHRRRWSALADQGVRAKLSQYITWLKDPGRLALLLYMSDTVFFHMTAVTDTRGGERSYTDFFVFFYHQSTYNNFSLTMLMSTVILKKGWNMPNINLMFIRFRLYGFCY